MLRQSYSADILRKYVRKKDFRIFQLKHKNEDELRGDLHFFSESINDGSFKFSKFENFIIRNKKAYKLNSFCDTVVLRHIDEILKRIYKVKQSDRSLISRQIKTLLHDNTSFSVIRTDVKTFYESINPKYLINKFDVDCIVSSKNCHLLKIAHLKDDDYGSSGLRRGLNISSTISEIYMRDFDKLVSQFDGVYFYARYVDDMIIFSSKSPTHVLSEVKSKLKSMNLELNMQKTRIMYYPCKKVFENSARLKRCDEADLCEHKNKNISFLGYSFQFACSALRNRDKQNNVEVRIASNKIKKIKTRITRSFLEYTNNRDFNLLYRRIQFLTGNFRVESKTRVGYLLSGIYYNYHLITKNDDLVDLDRFLRTAIYSKKSFWSKMNLSGKECELLCRLSFVSGFKNKICNKYTNADLKILKSCWKYE
jgi:predicted DNA binding CopG/RHH family protein